MQRPTYAPAHSPPLHHPVPQHISQVPNLRSPPPPQSQQQAQANSYGYPQQPQPQGVSGFMHPAFGGIMNDSTAQMGFQVGKSAVMAGHDYMEQNFNRYVNVSALKHAVMAFVTYILLSTLLAGLRGAFHPELLGLTATTAFVVVIFEILGLKLGCYLLSISNESQLLDLVAYSGYKFVGVIVTLVVAEIFNRGEGTGGAIGWTIFLYTFFANAFFLLRSLKYVLLPDQSPNTSSGASYTVARAQRNRRTQFLFIYSYIVQFVFMWILSRQDSSSVKAAKV